MSSGQRVGIIGLVLVMLAALTFFSINIGRNLAMSEKVPAPAIQIDEARFILKPYTGVGSGVYKHGTIVKVVNGQPQVVGHFDDDSGKLSAGTVELVEVK